MTPPKNSKELKVPQDIDNKEDIEKTAIDALNEIEKSVASRKYATMLHLLLMPPPWRHLKLSASRVAHRCYLSPEIARIATRLLLLKGAGNRNSPLNLYVEVRSIDSSLVKVFKKELRSYGYI